MNKAIAILHLFPNAVSGVDFVVRDDGGGQYIDSWHLAEPQPTEEELMAAWDAVQSAPHEPPPPTIEERLTELERRIGLLENA
jgi:XkdW protein